MAVKGIISAILAALCFGIMPILTKLLYGETGVDPFFFLMLRYTVAALLIWSFLLVTKSYCFKNLDRKSLVLIGITAFCYIIVTSTYFIALQYIDASLNSLLVFTFPVFTPFLGFLFFKEKLKWAQVLAALTSFAGCALLIGNYQLKGTQGELLGIGLGLLSGILYALFTLFGQRLTVLIEPLTTTALNITIVALFFLVSRANWLWGEPQPLQIYLIATIIAIVSTILANIFYFEAIRSLGAVKAGIFSSFEPWFTAILAIFFLNEQLSLPQWLGAVLILAGMLIIQRPPVADRS